MRRVREMTDSAPIRGGLLGVDYVDKPGQEAGLNQQKSAEAIVLLA